MLKSNCSRFKKQVPSIGEVRGLGLMLGIEIINPVKQPNTIGSYPAYPELARKKFNRSALIAG
ncbi:hypothetical protein GCM10020331_090220 [Ectobacillus funiculus]